MRIQLKSKQQIGIMREAGRLVAEAFAMIREALQPGIRISDLDRLTEDFIIRRGAKPLYKGYRGSQTSHPPFPGTICASVNDEICHGLPDRDLMLQEGDIIGIDIGLRYRGFCGDSCVSYAVGAISPDAKRLLAVTYEAMMQGIRAAVVENHLYDIGAAIEDYVRQHGMSVVREWGGHGIGKELHEPPSVLHTHMPVRGPQLVSGMVFTIEPMVNAGRPQWRILEDGWTVVTKDSSLSAQFEHTIAILPAGPQILSTL
ncbi:MAG: type I methionyl aminopeptidase [Chloroflexi bacterium]|nr:type I methionyl aminopeptidase [Chloroflexota bacterium]